MLQLSRAVQSACRNQQHNSRVDLSADELSNQSSVAIWAKTKRRKSKIFCATKHLKFSLASFSGKKHVHAEMINRPRLGKKYLYMPPPRYKAAAAAAVLGCVNRFARQRKDPAQGNRRTKSHRVVARSMHEGKFRLINRQSAHRLPDGHGRHGLGPRDQLPLHPPLVTPQRRHVHGHLRARRGRSAGTVPGSWRSRADFEGGDGQHRKGRRVQCHGAHNRVRKSRPIGSTTHVLATGLGGAAPDWGQKAPRLCNRHCFSTGASLLQWCN